MLLKDKKALIFGVANERSIAYGIAAEFKRQGARLAFSYVNEAIQKRVEPISAELGGEFIFPCDVQSDEGIAEAARQVRDKWGGCDVLVHSVAFANRDDLRGRYADTGRAGFHLALDVSTYSLVALSKAFEELMPPDSSIITLTYYGSEKVVSGYNVMGVAKSALDSSMRYLACDLGVKGIRVNAISAGPIKTLAASGIGNFKSILEKIEEKAALHRNVTIEDVGRTAVYLASELSSGVTGEVIHVDCGYSIMGV